MMQADTKGVARPIARISAISYMAGVRSPGSSGAAPVVIQNSFVERYEVVEVSALPSSLPPHRHHKSLSGTHRGRKL